MTGSPSGPSRTRLRGVLVRILREHRPGAVLEDVHVRPRLCRSSWAVEDLHLELADGERVHLVWKDLGRESEGSRAATVKPPSVREPGREPRVYRELLLPGDGPGCWGVEVDAEAGVHWIFLEPVAGVPLCEIGDGAAWSAAAAWLGGFHRRHRTTATGADWLLAHDATRHRSWYRRALERVDPAARRTLEDLAPLHEAAVERLFTGTTTLLHGEFYPANILVSWEDDVPRVVPVDWETAGPGPAALDLAALTCGDWSDRERAGFLDAYRRGAEGESEECMDRVDAAGLLLAVQWLGWPDRQWDPPPDLRHDWLDEAVRTAKRMTS